MISSRKLEYGRARYEEPPTLTGPYAVRFGMVLADHALDWCFGYRFYEA